MNTKATSEVSWADGKMEKGYTALSIAKKEGHEEIVQLLLEAGAVE